MREKKFFRNCPKCDKKLGYVNKINFNTANKKINQCISCAKKGETLLTRNCPECNSVLFYTKGGSRQTAEKNKRICRKCAIKKIDYNGEKNPFYGKKHSIETLKILSNASLNHIYTDKQKEQARIQLAKVANKKPIYDIWLEKYGKEEAEKRLLSFKNKQSIANSGEKNSMYGKPSPQGSGNGWSGWYKNWYFRSLRELSYMINVIEKESLIWRCPDKNFKIKYQDYKGTLRTYFPDFIINENKIVEIKPLKLHKTPKVMAKTLAAIEFCKNNNFIYEIIDVSILLKDKIKELYLNKEIKFLDRYDKKFREKYLIL